VRKREKLSCKINKREDRVQKGDIMEGCYSFFCHGFLLGFKMSFAYTVTEEKEQQRMGKKGYREKQGSEEGERVDIDASCVYLQRETAQVF